MTDHAAPGPRPGSPRQAQDLRLSDVRKSYGAFTAVHGIDIDVAAGSLVSLIGPSGCGKTTTLRMIAGLEPLSSGRVTSGAVVLSDGALSVPPERRDMGMVFQTYALWPHLRVADNVGYGLRRRGMNRTEVAERVRQVLAIVGMEHLADRYPGQLSGGQQQRVALARAVASQPRILLFDEPLSNLDAVLREQMRFEIRRLQQELGITSVYVTHSQDEALALSDRIVVMESGRVVQSGTPTEIYDRPRNAFVAGFIGLTNILDLSGASLKGGGLTGSYHGTPVMAAAGALDRAGGATRRISVRPTDIRIAGPDAPAKAGVNRLPGTVASTVFTGGLVDTFVAPDADPLALIRVQSAPPAPAGQGMRVTLEFDPARSVALED
ncbi:ABC transporter ATP-binding protein [Salipiger marinus]|uniref:ABC transporter ATP-binding protein n=1 Tax=Salipiger marinus TaxID=555512 RepID=UPI001E60FDF5|nr:ABC transporter ATP-binding protein [Salipiger manganoxidans]MCD1618724.1 ABC transporter ATP-binding protein [Salipiger manganoxidans]MEB3417836.1 ABC transporter ATP-binding protein [Salipiger manganoxidans]